jgi:hypothetical protein
LNAWERRASLPQAPRHAIIRTSEVVTMNHGQQEQQSSHHQAAAVWNVISLAAPIVGFACGVVAGLSAPHFQWFYRGFLVWLGFGVAGLLGGVIALVRAERLRGITLAGLILNALLVFLLVAWFISNGAFEKPEAPVPVIPASSSGTPRAPGDSGRLVDAASISVTGWASFAPSKPSPSCRNLPRPGAGRRG